MGGMDGWVGAQTETLHRQDRHELGRNVKKQDGDMKYGVICLP